MWLNDFYDHDGEGTASWQTEYECILTDDWSTFGVDGKGGLINCYRYARYLRIQCTTVCDPAISITMLKIWQINTINYNASPTIISGN